MIMVDNAIVIQGNRTTCGKEVSVIPGQYLSMYLFHSCINVYITIAQHFQTKSPDFIYTTGRFVFLPEVSLSKYTKQI